MPTNPNNANKDSVLIKLDFPIEMPPMLKTSPSAAMANETQKVIFTQEVVQVRSSKVPDSNCVPRKMANAQLMMAQSKEIMVFSVIAVGLVIIILANVYITILY